METKELQEMQTPETMTVLVVEPEKAPYLKEIGTDLESLQKAVGGYIEAVYPFEDPAAIVCCEDAKLTGMPLNRVLRDDRGKIYDVIAGTFLVTGLGVSDFQSLTDEQAQKFSRLFQTPEMFITVNGRLCVLPMEPRQSVREQLQKPTAQHSAPSHRPKSKEMEVR